MGRDRQIAEFCLHVRDDGEEVTFPGPPDNWQTGERRLFRDGLAVHHVVVLELEYGALYEETTIRSIKLDGKSAWFAPKARGRGWSVFDEASDKFTIWRRHHRPVPKRRTNRRPAGAAS